MHVKLSVKQLRMLVREAVQPDPFGKPSLLSVADAATRAKEIIEGELFHAAKAVNKGSENPSVKDAMSKAFGLAQHALHDLQAIESLVLVSFGAQRNK